MEANNNFEEECPICLNNISNDDAFLLLTCCNTKVHIQCLDEWYNKKGNKKKTCFLCTKESNDLESIIVHSPILRSNIEFNNNNNNDNYQSFRYFLIFVMCVFLGLYILKVFE